LKNIKIRTIKKIKRIQKSLQNWKGRTAAKVQEALMEATAYLMNGDNQLCMRLR